MTCPICYITVNGNKSQLCPKGCLIGVTINGKTKTRIVDMRTAYGMIPFKDLNTKALNRKAFEEFQKFEEEQFGHYVSDKKMNQAEKQWECTKDSKHVVLTSRTKNVDCIVCGSPMKVSPNQIYLS